MREVHIASVFKNEARYLREWIEFHRIVGIAKFILYQNNSEDDYMSVLQPYIDGGIVDLKQWPMLPPMNMHVYADVFRRVRTSQIWLACIDCDEFLFSPKYATIGEALDTFPDAWGAVAVNWRCFGSSGKEVWEDIPVIERFTWHSSHPTMEYMDKHVKSIVKMDRAVRLPTSQDHIHTFNVQGGTFSEVGWFAEPGAHAEHHSEILRINHYWSKSRQEWAERIATGKPDIPPGTAYLNWSVFDQISQQDTEDKDIQIHLPRLKEALHG